MEQLQDEAIATAGPEQHGPSEQKQKKKARGQGGSGNRYYRYLTKAEQQGG